MQSLFELKGKRALITGSAQAIGECNSYEVQSLNKT